MVVTGKMGFMGGLPEEEMAYKYAHFALCGLLATMANILGAEIYFYLTREETERLKRVSSARRRARGLKV